MTRVLQAAEATHHQAHARVAVTARVRAAASEHRRLAGDGAPSDVLARFQEHCSNLMEGACRPLHAPSLLHQELPTGHSSRVEKFVDIAVENGVDSRVDNRVDNCGDNSRPKLGPCGRQDF